MKRGIAHAAAICLLTAAPALAHRLDEYLQGSLVSIEKDRVKVQMTLTPGVAVFPAVFSDIDIDADGAISDIEQRAYATRVLGDLSLRIDGSRLTPRLLSMRFPATGDMKEGRGEIQLDFTADLPNGNCNRKLTLENHHQNRISVYQVNSLVPRDPDIRISAQNRNYSQSRYELEYAQKGTDTGVTSFALTPGRLEWLGGGVAFLLLLRLALMARRRAWHARAA